MGLGETVVTATMRRNWSRMTVAWKWSLYVSSYYLIATNVATAVLGFLYWTAAARLYQPREVGLAAGAVSIIGLLTMLALLGLDHAIVRFLPHSSDPESIINSSITVASGAALCLSLFFVAGLNFWAPALVPLRHNPLLIISLVIATASATVSSLLISAFLSRKQASFVFVQSLVFSATKVLAVVFFSIAPSAWGMIGAWALGLFAAASCGVAILLPRLERSGHQFRPALKLNAMTGFAHFALANWLTTLFWSGATFLLPLLVINSIGAEANAYFYAAWSVSGLLTMIPMSVSLALFAHGSSDEEQVIQYTLRSGRFALVLLLPALIAALLFSEKLLLLFGKGYSEQGTRLLWILALSALPLTVNFLFVSVKRIQGRMFTVIGASAWILLATLAFSAVLLPRVGIIGPGLAWFAAQSSVATIVLVRYAFAQ